MTDSPRLDPLVLGRRLRHFRNEAGMTLDDLGEKVGKTGPYLSLLENGKKQPKLALVLDLAEALGVELQQLLDPTPPSYRDQLEIRLMRFQASSLFESLDLPRIRPSARLDDKTLSHVVGMQAALQERSGLGSASSEEIRRANGEIAVWVQNENGYLDHIEESASLALETAGYAGAGPLTSRNLIDLTARTGFEILPIEDMPSFARSLVDLENRRIYIAQRNELRTRQARKAILQTLASFLLEHEREPDLPTFLRQRVETAYFAAAVLVPETAAIPGLTDAKANHDINAEDIKESFYVSYEMAAWRIANLFTKHFDKQCHLIVSDPLGSIVKGYSNDGAPVRRDQYGGMETQKLCERWGSRVTFRSADRFAIHHQYTDTPAGTYFCTTHIETGREPAHAITFGVPFKDAKWFRGRESDNRSVSTCPNPSCCRVPPASLSSKWEDKVVVSARSQERILGLLAPDPYPELNLTEVLSVVDRHSE